MIASPNPHRSSPALQCIGLISMTSPLTLSSLPLFPLEAVLFPAGLLALRVFEVRYLTMVRKCYEVGAPFGVVCLQSGSETRRADAPADQFCSVGTLAHVQTLESPQAGLLLARCTGSTRFQVQRSAQLPNGLWVADVVQWESDPVVPVPEHLATAAWALEPVLSSLRDHHGEHAVATPAQDPLADSGWVANRWCELLPLPLPLRQRMMELGSPLVRLELVEDMLEGTGIAGK